MGTSEASSNIALCGPVPYKPFSEVVRRTGEAMLHLKDNPGAATYLTESIKNIFAAREALVRDAQYTTSILLVPIAGAGAICSTTVALWKAEHPQYLLMAFAFLFASGVLYLVEPMSRALLAKLNAAYELYVSSAVHAMIIHRAMGIPPACHRWLLFADFDNPDFRGFFSDRVVHDSAINLSARVSSVHDETGRQPQDVFELESAWKEQGGTLLAAYKSLVSRFTLVGRVGASAIFITSIFLFWKWMQGGS